MTHEAAGRNSATTRQSELLKQYWQHYYARHPLPGQVFHFSPYRPLHYAPLPMTPYGYAAPEVIYGSPIREYVAPVETIRYHDPFHLPPPSPYAFAPLAAAPVVTSFGTPVRDHRRHHSALPLAFSPFASVTERAYYH